MFWRYLNFVLKFFGHVGNNLIRKLRLIPKFLTSQTGKQIITIYVLLNILRSKGNQITKFDQLIDTNWETLFLKNDTQNKVEKLVPDPFIKNKNWACLWISSLKFYIVCFFVCPGRGLPNYIKSKVLTTCFYLIQSIFEK